jgi:hypothetical protein
MFQQFQSGQIGKQQRQDPRQDFSHEALGLAKVMAADFRSAPLGWRLR